MGATIALDRRALRVNTGDHSDSATLLFVVSTVPDAPAYDQWTHTLLLEALEVLQLDRTSPRTVWGLPRDGSAQDRTVR